MNIFSVHPADRDLNFLKSLNTDLKKKYSSFQYLRLEANLQTHEECIRILGKNKDGLLFFFCHALDKSIRGCKIESEASSASAKDFYYGPLISPTKNIEIFAGKRIFCLACFSRDLGEHAIKAGAKVYLGFGNIPFFVTQKFKVDKVEAYVKAEMKSIIFSVLNHAIDKNLSFNEVSALLTISFDKKRFELMANSNPGRKLRLEVAKVLSIIKDGITMFGNGNERMY